MARRGQPRVLGKSIGETLIRSDQRSCSTAKGQPPLCIASIDVRRAGEDGDLVVQNIFGNVLPAESSSVRFGFGWVLRGLGSGIWAAVAGVVSTTGASCGSKSWAEAGMHAKNTASRQGKHRVIMASNLRVSIRNLRAIDCKRWDELFVPSPFR